MLTCVVNTVVKHIFEIKEQVIRNTQLLHEIVRRQRGSERDKVHRLPPTLVLPLKTYSALLEVEQKLKSKEFYSSLVNRYL